MRLKIIRTLILISFFLIAGTLFYYQAVQGEYYYQLSRNNRIRVIPLDGWRGKILDINGEVLADNRLSYNLAVLPQEIEDKQSLFVFLANVFGKSVKKINDIYVMKKSTPFAPVVIQEDLTQDQIVEIEENRFRFPSLIVQKSYARFYPYGSLLSHVLGYVAPLTENRIAQFKEYGYPISRITGYTGIEEFYDQELQGEPGGFQIEVNSRGKQQGVLGVKEPQRGHDLTLTIDMRVQQLMEEALNGERGAFVMMDASNGEIIGMASSPKYDPNVFEDNRRKNEKVMYLRDGTNSPMMNRAINAFTPGSVFKVIMAIAGLHSSKVNPFMTFFCTGEYNFKGTIFGCTHVHGSENLREALAHSCNVYFYHLGQFLGVDLIEQYAKVFGLGQVTRIDVPQESSGFLPNKRSRIMMGRHWFPGDTLNYSIGQGDLLVSPIQLTQLMAVIANDGKEPQPHLLKSLDGLETAQFKVRKLIAVNQPFMDIIKQGLRDAVEDPEGTAHSLDMPGYYIAGKTGTAQTGGTRPHHAWFSGFVKSDHKTLAFTILLEHGGSSANACLVGRQVLEGMKELGIL